MKFYNREKEFALLQKIQEKSSASAQMTFMVGRRRIGKTSLLIRQYGSDCIYFFVAKKNEVLLCEEFVDEVRGKLHAEIYGEIKSFKDLFGYLMKLSQTTPFTLIIDEFQEFASVNPSIYSDMQHLWDSNKADSKINLILCGSVYSLMKRIFEHSKEPLFGRATQRIHLKELGIETLKEIIRDYHPGYTEEDLLAFYMITGGVAKYVEYLVEAEAFTLDAILNEIFSENSLFLDEGRNVLIDEFGKDYNNYFSILSLIASSKTSRPEIESVLEIPVGGFLDRLENDFGIISRIRPIFAKPGGRSVKYVIKDNFLNFWFRFIYKYRGTVEMGNLEYVRSIVERDYPTYSGRILEKYFLEKMTASKQYSTIGNYWEKDNHNEIDIVAVNEIEKRMTIAEVKRKKENISLPQLKMKSENLCNRFSEYSVEYRGLSMDDM